MQLRYRVACGVAGAVAVLLAVMRLVGGLQVAVPCLAALAVLALFFLYGTERRDTLPVSGVTALLISGAAALTGTSLLISGGGMALDFVGGVYPYPQPVAITVVGKLLVVAMVAGAVVGGVFFLLLAVRWFLHRHTDRGAFGAIALMPIVWSWGRLLWYMTSFTSAVNRFRSLVEVAMLLFEMVFLLIFARYVSGVEEKTPRFAVPVALCTAMLGLAACMTRFGAYLLQTADTFADAALVSAPDLGVALLAAAFAAGQLFGKPCSAALQPEPEPEAPVEQEAEEPAAFLLDEEDLAAPDAEEDEGEVSPAEERRPLELEDIINEIINGRS